MKRNSWVFAAAAAGLAIGGSALAVKQGETLYIKAKNTKVMKTASPTSAAVAMLQPGAKVTWNGSDPAQKQWHRVSFEGKSGLVFQSNLSPKPPSMELSSKGGGSIDAQAFASSGAATKALSEGALKYADNKKMADAPKELLTLEAIAAQVKQSEISEHNKKAGLPVTVAAEGDAR